MRTTHRFRKVMAVLIAGLIFLQLVPAQSVLAAADDKTAYYTEIGEKLERWANQYNIPPVLLKAIAWMESGWRQYETDAATGLPDPDKPLISYDGIGIGIMQISSYDPRDTVTINKLKNDIDYNIETGCQILNQKWRTFPKIGNGDRNVLENWYFAVWGYNSWATRNNPNTLNGQSAYQDSVFSLMGQKYNSAITFAPGAAKFPATLLPSVNPPSLASRWSTPTSTHTGDLTIDPDSLMSSGGGSGTDAANGDYWYNYARWSSYYALGFYDTAYNSSTVTDKTAVAEKILNADNNLLAEADALLLKEKDSSDADAAKYYWTVLQGPDLDSGVGERAKTGLQTALSHLLAEANQLSLTGTGSSLNDAIEDYCVILQSDSLDEALQSQAKAGLLSAYSNLLAVADNLALEETDAAKVSAAKYYLTVQQGPALDASLTERAKAGYQKINSTDSDSVPSTSSTTPATGSDTTSSTTPATGSDTTSSTTPATGSDTTSTTPTTTSDTTPTQAVPDVVRLSGLRAEDTAIAISQAGWAAGSSPVVLLARADQFQDALAAAPLARKLKAPLLLTAPGQLDPAVLQEIKRLGAESKIYVIGGKYAINETVTNDLSAAGLTTERIFGNTAADTAAEIARRLGSNTEVILASSTSFPDALSASAPAAALGIPILLTERNTLPDSTKQILKDFSVTKTIIVGGKFAISTALDSKGGPLESYGPLRLAGETKYDTMLEIVNYFKQDPADLVIATGVNFPDGLAGGAFAALTGSPMLLIPQDGLNDDTKAFVENLKGKTAKAYILGGTGVISADNEKLIGNLLTQ